MNDVRRAVSRVCGGVDDMQLLGQKALVLRAEIYPEKLSALYDSLSSSGVKVSAQNLPGEMGLEAETEYPITLQITGLSDDTDDPIAIPKVPG